MDQSLERWLPVVGYEGFYEVSDQGRVRSLGIRRNGSRQKPCIMVLSPGGKNGKYRRVLLRNPDRWRQVHQLVLEAFVGPAGPGQEAMHLNHDPGDNSLSNLRWGTKRENEDAKVANGTTTVGERNPAARLTPHDVLAIRADARRQVDIAAHYGIAQAHVSAIKLRKCWAHV